MTRLASLDVGSNSVLLCVGEILPGSDFRVLYESFKSTRLGGGMDREGRLADDAVRRTLAALGECRRKAEILGVVGMRAVATAAVREASNPEDFLAPAEEVLGVKVEVISGEREAELTFLGAVGGARAEPLVLLDVGGRSTELILAGDGRIRRLESLPLGAVRLREDLPSEASIPAYLKTVPALLPDLDPAEIRGATAVAVGGTATTLAAVRIEMRRYDGDLVEGLVLSREEILDLVKRIAATPLGDRAKIPGLPASRADIITAGGWLLARILLDLGADEVTISSRGLRHGLLWEMTREKA